MKSKDYIQCLKLANQCHNIREFRRLVVLHEDVHSDLFYMVCRGLNQYKRINAELLAKYGKGKQRFIARMNQAISRAPRIRFWA